MTTLHHFAYPHDGAWAAVYIVPGTHHVLHIVCVFCNLRSCEAECRRLNRHHEAHA